jgi:hypothetical protein
MFRMKNEDGTWLFSEEECLRRIEVMLERAKKIWSEERLLERAENEKALRRGAAPGKPAGRGRNEREQA